MIAIILMIAFVAVGLIMVVLDQRATDRCLTAIKNPPTFGPNGGC